MISYNAKRRCFSFKSRYIMAMCMCIFPYHTSLLPFLSLCSSCACLICTLKPKIHQNSLQQFFNFPPLSLPACEGLCQIGWGGDDDIWLAHRGASHVCLNLASFWLRQWEHGSLPEVDFFPPPLQRTGIFPSHSLNILASFLIYSTSILHSARKRLEYRRPAKPPW
jgi:hypothetical protein